MKYLDVAGCTLSIYNLEYRDEANIPNNVLGTLFVEEPGRKGSRKKALRILGDVVNIEQFPCSWPIVLSGADFLVTIKNQQKKEGKLLATVFCNKEELQLEIIDAQKE